MKVYSQYTKKSGHRIGRFPGKIRSAAWSGMSKYLYRAALEANTKKGAWHKNAAPLYNPISYEKPTEAV